MKAIVLFLLLLSSGAQASDVFAAIRPHMNRAFDHNGGNCWSTVLFTLGLRPALSYADDREFKYVMDESGRCERLADGEPVRAGDVGALRDGLDEIHAFLYVNEEKTLSKRDFTAAARIRFHTLAGELADYPGLRLTRYRCRTGNYESLLDSPESPKAWRLLKQVGHFWLHGLRYTDRQQQQIIDDINSFWDFIRANGGEQRHLPLIAYMRSIAWQFSSTQGAASR